jgi:hypothetical protein
VKRLLLALSLVALAGAATTVRAQGARRDLLRQATTAYDDFDIARAARFARAALDPSLGARDTTWARGVHLLTQLLIEDNQQAQAETWAKWAMRLEPTLQIDSVNFLGGVVTALREARAAAGRTAADDATRETFGWPTATATGTEARLRLAPSAVPVSVLVRGVGLLTAGAGITLAPGTYELEVSASGYLPLRITREALPGVITEFAFTLTSAAAAANTLAADVRARVNRSIVPLTVTRFGTPPACAVGVTAAGGRLVLTSYHAVRGADGVASGATGGDAVRVAAWDVAANLAVLVVPNAPADTLPLAATLIDGQALFGIGLAACRTTNETRVVLNAWEGRPAGSLALSEPLAGDVLGSPFVDFQGSIAGVWNAGPTAVPAAVIASLLRTARTNVAAGRLVTPQALAVQENHRFGTVVIAADVPNATIRVTPVEAWHWEGLVASGNGPLTFSGPAGRYRVQASAPEMQARTQEITITAGASTRSTISLRVAQGPQAVGPRRGMPKWVWIAVVGGGAAAALALGGGGGGGTSGGSIGISVPNP